MRRNTSEDSNSSIHYREGMTGLEEHFDRDDRKNFRFLEDPVTGKPATGETLTIPRANANDSGLYFCIGKTSEDFSAPGSQLNGVLRTISEPGSRNQCCIPSENLGPDSIEKKSS